MLIEKETKKSKLYSFQLLRCVSAIIVFMAHFSDNYNMNITFSGRFGVAFFFAISSYLLVYQAKNGIKDYFIKKIIRIIPLYYIMTFMVVLVYIVSPSTLHTVDVNIITVIKSFLFIPFYTEGMKIPIAIHPLGWTMVIQVFVYIIFFICYKITKKADKAGLLCSIVIIVFVILGSVFKYKNIFLFAYGQTYMIFFIIGFIFAIIFEFNKYNYIKKIVFTNKNVIVNYIYNIAIFILCIFISMFFEENFSGILVFLGLFFLVVCSKEIHCPKIFNIIGNISYSFYLVHYAIIKLIDS